jgi:hypothetical protein
MHRPPSARWLLLSLLIGCVLCSAGCQTARYVRKDGAYGEVAIPSNSNSWPYYNRDQAEKLMSEHFPDGYEVDVEEEAVIGQKTDYSENGSGAGVPIRIGRNVGLGVGIGNKTGTATTTNKTEWRFRYRRKGARQAAANAEEIPGLEISEDDQAPPGDTTVLPATGQSSMDSGQAETHSRDPASRSPQKAARSRKI